MTADPRRSTAGFTLIELIVVLGIVALVTTIAVVVTLRMQDRDQVPRAATLVQGMLSQAKARAAAERVNIGVRFVDRLNRGENGVRSDRIRDELGNINPIPWNSVWSLADGADNDGNGWVDDLVLCDTLVFVRDPGDFTDGWVQTGFVMQGGVPQPMLGCLFLLRSDSYQQQFIHDPPSSPLNRQNLANFVQEGDWIQIQSTGEVYRIKSVSRFDDPNDSYSAYNCVVLDDGNDDDDNDNNNSDLLPKTPIGWETNQLPGRASARYRIIRQPQILPGEKPVQLPAGALMEIRPGLTLGFDSLLKSPTSTRPLEIVFSPQGSVVWPPEANAEGLIALWIRYHRAPIDPDLETFVAVYPKSGAVLTFPVDRTSPDPHSFIRTGRSANAP